jgi:folate-binding protein YgfZ
VTAAARGARAGPALFVLGARALVEVRGGDRVRWLNGMVTNDVAAAAARGAGAGCYALLLTREGRIVADLHVLVRDDALWLETDAAAVGTVLERLAKYVIADDVTLADRSADFERLALEGPGAEPVLAALAGDVALPPAEGWVELEVAGARVPAAAFAFAGGPGFQLFAPRGRGAEVRAALLAAGARHGLVPGDEALLERSRIEAGVPRFGRELDETVLPDEARLERAVSTAKGCYTGQEVVARMRSRGRVSHLLVGLRCAGGGLPTLRAPVQDLEGRRVGEVTSAALSPRFGAIALAFVRRPWDAAGTHLRAGEVDAEVVGLPFGLAPGPR